jgi:hypothetical protein
VADVFIVVVALAVFAVVLKLKILERQLFPFIYTQVRSINYEASRSLLQ